MNGWTTPADQIEFRAFQYRRRENENSDCGISVCSVGDGNSGAQDKLRSDDSSTEPRAIETTPLKISVTFAEFEGDKKVKSLPYTMVVIADGRPPKSVLKMGSRVPVYTRKENGMQYLDVGSNLECQAFRTKANRFDAKLDLDRSWG